MAPERTSGGFGSKLRDARERRGISLRHIANATKISMSALEALERNDIARLPGGIFSRAFVRSYALEVGLDPEVAIQEFIAQFPHDSVTAGHPTTEHVDDNEIHESNRRMASTFVRLIAASLPIAGVVIYFGAGNRRSMDAPSEPAAVVAEAAPAPPVATAPPSAPLPGGPPPAAPAPVVEAAPPLPPPAGAGRLEVTLLATGACWVSAMVDGERVITREFQSGERQTLEVRRELVLTAGDAAALKVTLNGVDARPLGNPGRAVTVRLTPANFSTYLASP